MYEDEVGLHGDDTSELLPERNLLVRRTTDQEERKKEDNERNNNGKKENNEKKNNGKKEDQLGQAGIWVRHVEANERAIIHVFNGDKKQYQSWKAAFMTCIDKTPVTAEYKVLQQRS